MIISEIVVDNANDKHDVNANATISNQHDCIVEYINARRLLSYST